MSVHEDGHSPPDVLCVGDVATDVYIALRADQVTLLSATNDSVTLQLDAETHLPLRRIFRWRNPTYKDKDEDIEEYDNYRIVDGIQTPYSIPRYRNGDMVNERFLLGAEYDRTLPADQFDPQATARRLVK